VLTHLSCWLCGKTYPFDKPINTCTCGKPLRADYALDSSTLDRAVLRDREPNMWRYREVMPPCEPITLGEGMTPLQWTPRLGERWYVKDEGLNPTASFKARGMSAAISMATHFGIEKVAVPSAGNAAGAMAAYAAKAGIQAFAFMPRDTPNACIIECDCLRTHVELIDGLITDCAAEIAKRKDKEGWFDLSTLKEPYRAEGKKTMGYELAEQMEWSLPDVIIYPTGGGTGLVGMWKAFDEMERMGWIGKERPRMVSVQASGCAPIVRAYERGERFAAEFENAHTAAAGLRVPRAIADFVMLDLIHASNGTAISVSDEDMIRAAKQMSESTGIFACPEGGATLAAARKLRESGFIRSGDTVVLFNTGSGVKYLEALSDTNQN